MKKISLLLILFSFLKFHLGAQDTFILEGKVIDAKTNLPLEKVNIFNQTSVFGAYSELDGTFQIEIEDYPTVIIFSYIGYENLLLTIEEEPTEPITIRLQRSIFGLPEIEVTDQPKIEKLTKKNYTVKDFILDKNKILILTFPGTFSGNKLILKDWDGTVLDKLKLEKEKVQTLHRSCLGNIHLVGKKYGFEIGLQDDKILIISKYPARQFEKLIEPCVAATDQLLYWQKYSMQDQFLTYTIISKKEKDIITKIKVVDGINISRSMDDFVLQDALPDVPQASWIERQSWKQLMYKPIFSPLKIYHNELCLFDHVNGYLEFFTFKGTSLRYLPITYHQNKKWEKQILFDKKYNKAYTVYDTKKGKSIYEINLKDGSVEPIVFFNATHIEKMEVYDGHLFYLESGVTNADRNRVLHRVKL